MVVQGHSGAIWGKGLAEMDSEVEEVEVLEGNILKDSRELKTKWNVGKRWRGGENRSDRKGEILDETVWEVAKLSITSMVILNFF